MGCGLSSCAARRHYRMGCGLSSSIRQTPILIKNGSGTCAKAFFIEKEAQEVATKASQLLSSSIPTATTAGVSARRDGGEKNERAECLYPMRLVPLNVFEEAGKFSKWDRHQCGAYTTLHKIIERGRRSSVFIVYISHRWANLSIADTRDHLKYHFAVKALKEIKELLQEGVEIFVWFDLFGLAEKTHQPEEFQKGCQSLPFYIKQSDCLLTVYTDKLFQEAEVDLPLPPHNSLLTDLWGKWPSEFYSLSSDDADGYFGSPWCRLEMDLGHRMLLSQDGYHFFEKRKVARQGRPHYICGDYMNGALFLLPDFAQQFWDSLDQISNGRSKIAKKQLLDDMVAQWPRTPRRQPECGTITFYQSVGDFANKMRGSRKHYCNSSFAVEAARYPMRLLSLDVLKECRRIPRSSDTDPILSQATELGVLASSDWRKSFIVFVSHRWWSNDHPEASKNSTGKYNLIISALERIKSFIGLRNEAQVYCWIDYFCIDQEDCEQQENGIQSLPFYVSNSDVILTPYSCETISNSTQRGFNSPLADFWGSWPNSYKSLSYSTDEYFGRAWCRLELFLAAHAPRMPGRYRAPGARGGVRHFLVGVDMSAPLELPAEELARTLDPCGGALGNQRDLPWIRRLVKQLRLGEVRAARARPHDDQKLVYVGGRDAAGRPHGVGALAPVTAGGLLRCPGAPPLPGAEGVAAAAGGGGGGAAGPPPPSRGPLYHGSYCGEWRAGEPHGLGVAVGRDGAVYSGEHRAGQRHGVGVLRLANGGVHAGGWLEGAAHGEGRFWARDGYAETGSWVAGRRFGPFEIMHAEGVVEKGEYYGDERHGEFKVSLLEGREGGGELLSYSRERYGGVYMHGERVASVGYVKLIQGVRLVMERQREKGPAV